MVLTFGGAACRHLVAIEQVQMYALGMLFGVGTLHPKASLWHELKMLPLV